MLEDDDPKDEKIFELMEENKRLRNQVTYLQEELASVEDALNEQVETLQGRIEELEILLGDALYGDYD